MKTQRLMCVCHRNGEGCMSGEKMTKYPVSCVCVHYTTLVRPCSGARKTQRLMCVCVCVCVASEMARLHER